VKVKINNVGNLLVERAGVLKPQGCPYKSGDVPCGDWCPLFQEREGVFDICETSFTYTELIDERGQDESG